MELGQDGDFVCGMGVAGVAFRRFEDICEISPNGCGLRH
jgi:hypothetical protein